MLIFELEWNAMAPSLLSYIYCFGGAVVDRTMEQPRTSHGGVHKWKFPISAANKAKKEICANSKKSNGRRLCNFHIVSLENRFLCQTHVGCACVCVCADGEWCDKNVEAHKNIDAKNSNDKTRCGSKQRAATAQHVYTI